MDSLENKNKDMDSLEKGEASSEPKQATASSSALWQRLRDEVKGMYQPSSEEC